MVDFNQSSWEGAVRRALVGFSSPIGYDYKWPAQKSSSDMSSSPNPILLGSMGLFVLYDEIWFACESLCPQSMRKLDYVRFLDKEMVGVDVVSIGIESAQEYVFFPGQASLHDVFEGGYADMKSFAGDNRSIDNHTHGIKFFNTHLSGNISDRQLAVDIWIINNFPEKYFELILNPATAKMALGNDVNQGLVDERIYDELLAADKIVSLKNLYDISGKNGPYHPCVEEIRNDDLIVNFRRWLGSERSRLDNRALVDIRDEVDERLLEVKMTALDKYAESYSLKNIMVDLVQGKISDALGVSFSLVDYLGKLPSADENRAYTFMAKAHLRQEDAIRRRQKRGSF